MAVEFLSGEQAGYGVFVGAPSRAELERYFFLDDADREAVQTKRRAHNRLGYAVQLTSVRYLGRFLPDPRHLDPVSLRASRAVAAPDQRSDVPVFRCAQRAVSE